jgi:hypothetical protein
MNRFRNVILFCFAFLMLSATFATAADNSNEHSVNWLYRQSPLVQMVRQATEQFKDVQVAIEAGYVATSCVSGPNGGAMGIHFVNSALLGDGLVDPTHPEALVYEPLPGGQFLLVSVEYLTFAENWHVANEEPPVINGQLFHYVGSPNRGGLPAYYELHVWAWKYNPTGTFADWNPRVSCDAYDPN